VGLRQAPLPQKENGLACRLLIPREEQDTHLAHVHSRKYGGGGWLLPLQQQIRLTAQRYIKQFWNIVQRLRRSVGRAQERHAAVAAEEQGGAGPDGNGEEGVRLEHAGGESALRLPGLPPRAFVDELTNLREIVQPDRLFSKESFSLRRIYSIGSIWLRF
jgi:hypothetical protein